MRHWPILVGLLAAASICGCGEKAIHAKTPTKVKIIQSAVSLSPGTTEILGSKMSMVRLVGRTASCNYPLNIKTAPVVLNGVKPNYEMILESKAEAVVYDPELFSESDLKPLADAGLTLVPIGGDDVKSFVKRLYEVGSQFLYETAIMEYVGEIERAEAAARGVQPTQAPKVAVLMPDERGGHMIAGTQSLVADVVRICGGTPVGPGSARFELASIESLVTWNPDLIACTPKYEWVTGDARLQSIRAVQQFKLGAPSVAQLNPDIVLRRGVRLHVLISNLSNFIARKMGQ